MSKPLVQLAGLEKRYGERTALRGIDLTIDECQIFGVVGPDGAGKTTLLRSIAGLLEVQAREARVLGHDLTADVTELKARVGYVPQSFSLYRELSVLENLSFTARLHRLPEAEFAARSRELLERTALAPFGDRPAGALSGGMRQKLAIANALLARPALVVLDEPTAGVDIVARREIWALLERERHERLVLWSTSYLDEAEACDRLAYLDDGRIVADGTPAALRAKVPLELYRVWSDDARAIARAARALPYVQGARAAGHFARVEVRHERTPGVERVLHDLSELPGGTVRFAEQMAPDMESTLLGLAQRPA